MKRITLLSIIILFSAILNFAQPDWNPVIYTNSTTAYGIVTIDANAAATGDIVGAFVGNECRAKGDVIINSGNAYVTLLIQGESVEVANFKVYDASADKIYDLEYTTNTNPGNTIGTPPDYLPLAALSQVTTDSLKVSPANRDVSSESGTTDFSVESNIIWIVSENEDWLSVSPTSGSNNETLTVSFDANPSTTERVGTISVNGNGLNEDITVTQAGRTSPCDPNWEPVIYTNSTTAYGIVTIDGVPAAEDDIVGAFVGEECRAVGSIIINNNNAYVTMLIQGENIDTVNFRIFDKSECAELFLQYTTESNPGNTIGVPPNYLPIAYTTQSDSLAVMPDSVLVDADSGRVSIAITSNIVWDVNEELEWISVTPINGSGNGNLTIIFDANPTTDQRVGTFTIDGSRISREVVVTQSGGSLPEAPTLIAPENNTELEDTVSSVEFVWSSAQFADTYSIEISVLENFDSLVVELNELIDTTILFTEQIIPGQYFWRVRADNAVGSSDWSEAFVITIITGIEDDANAIPSQYRLHQNFPNPFNPTTMVKFGIPEDSNVKIEIFNMLGQRVDVLVEGEISAGVHETNWNATNLPSGIYLISIKANGINSSQNFVQVKKALLLK